MCDSFKARISTVEHIQKEFGQLVKLIKLIEGQTRNMLEDTCGSPSLLLQPTLNSLVPQHCLGHEPYTLVVSNVPPKIYHPNWQPQASKPTITPTFEKAFRPINQVSSSEKNLEKLRMSQDNNQWHPIPITYTELLPRLLERQPITLSYALPLKPPFLKVVQSQCPL